MHSKISKTWAALFAGLFFSLCLSSCISLLLSSAVSAKDMPAGNWIGYRDLPREAQATLAMIRQGGPFASRKDGVVFGNYEKILPRRPRGYYHEYTVKTPGARNRGARRIIAGGSPPQPVEYFYTEDHYATFSRIQE